MRVPTSLLRSLSCLLLVPLAAQGAAPVPKPLRVHIVGASVSGGFEDGPATGATEQGESVPLVAVLKAWAGDDARVTTHNPLRMQGLFLDPPKLGAEQIEGALRAKPDVLVAFDFPFWFAYGHVDRGGEGGEAKARADRLAGGLDLLARLDVPMLVGDLPDMQGAARRMLSPRQIPAPDLLEQLNAQLAAWAAARPNVHLVPLGSLVRTMKDQGVELPLADGSLRTPPGALLQGDRLHATRLGMAFLGLSLQGPLCAAFPAGHPLRQRAWTLAQFVEATGAGPELDLLRANLAGPRAPAAGGGR
jgi:hypothetical protein